MTDQLTLTGLVATAPRHLVTAEGLPITSFRLASTRRKFDRAEQKWIDADTNWFSVTAFRQLAVNVASSVEKGQRVVVTGRLRVRDWESGEKNGTTVEIDADALGHDLAWGSAVYTRSSSRAASESTSSPESPSSAAEGPSSAPSTAEAADEVPTPF